MTQKIKERLKQAATDHAKGAFDYESAYIGFKKAAQTILENPQEWGLVDEKLFRSLSNSCESWANKWAEKSEKCRELQSQLAKYREALERIIDKYYSQVSEIGEPKWIAKELVELAKEALKNSEG